MDKEFIRIDNLGCSELTNCYGVRREDDKAYCRGCGDARKRAEEAGYGEDRR